MPAPDFISWLILAYPGLLQAKKDFRRVRKSARSWVRPTEASFQQVPIKDILQLQNIFRAVHRVTQVG
jgi:hypothetical protein